MARGRRTAVSTHPRALSTEPGRTSLLTAASPDAISEDTPCLGSPSSRRRPSPSCGRASGGPCRAPSPTSSRHARRRPALGGRHRRSQSVLAQGRRGSADDPVRDGPHRVRIRRWPARCPRDVRRYRFPLGPPDPHRGSHRRRQRAARSGREAVAVREAGDPADLPDDVFEPARRGRVRGRLLVLPHGARHRARAGQVRPGRVDELHFRSDRRDRAGLRRRADPWRDATAGRRRSDRRRAARRREGPADRDLRHRLHSGLGQPLHPRSRRGLRSLRAAPRARHSERVRRAGASRAGALGRRARACGGRAGRLRLWPGARRLAGSPGDQLDGRRRVPPPAERPGPASQPDRRHHVVPGARHRKGRGRRGHARARRREPARRDDGSRDRRRRADAGRLMAARSYREALATFSWDALWRRFDGDRRRLNIAHECVDRHAGRGTALRVQFADGRREAHDFDALAAWSSRFAHFLELEGIERGDRVAIMLEPSLPFYGALFGAMKRGAIAVPLFTLFGPDGVALRLGDCRPRMLLVERDATTWQASFPHVRVLAIDRDLAGRLERLPVAYEPSTAADDLAVFQYTSGTTRALPEAVRHTHRSVVTLMIAALYGVGLETGDRYFCPSSPAWGHGLWHGTIAPLALGIAVGAYSGRFDAGRLFDALDTFAITNVAAAPTVYRMARAAGWTPAKGRIAKCSLTGEPMDGATREFLTRALGAAPCSMYGSTEVGVVLVDYPGFDGYVVRPGALGSAAPGWEVAVVDDAGAPVAHGVVGEIAVRRRGAWLPVRDRGWMDADGYVHHAGRSDDVIISAGWTMSAVEIEQVLLRHPDIRDAAVIAVTDATRGQIPKAFVVAERAGPAFEREVQEWVKTRLSLHEYPRAVQVVDALPRTPAGKVDRRALRAREVSHPPG